MKNKKAFKIGLLSTVVVGMAIAVTAISMNHGKLFMGRGVLHDGSCQWNHYDEVAATYVSHGSKEFWACCTHPGEAVLEAPAEGTINDMGPLVGEYFDSLSAEDPRYIPMLEGGNKFARVDVIGWQDSSLLYTTATYSSITSVSFKVRVTGELPDNIWKGIAFNNNHSDWEGIVNFSCAADGEWHDITLAPLDKNGYVCLSYNMDHVIEGATIDIDDFTIVCGSGTITEDFEDMNNCIFTFDGAHARFDGEPGYDGPTNTFARVNVKGWQDSSLLYTTSVYTGVTSVSFKARLIGDIPDSIWKGIAFNESHSDWEGIVNFSCALDGEWHDITLSPLDKNGYVCLSYNMDHFIAGAFIDIDDFKITTGSGSVFEDFEDKDNCLFTYDAEHVRLAKEPKPEEPKTLGVVALDARTTTVSSKNYSPTFTVERGADEDYGAYFQLNDWQCNAGQNRCWIQVSQTRLLADIEAELGEAVDSYFLYVYNPLETSFSLDLMLESYTKVSSVGLAAQTWTKVTFPVGIADSHGSLSEAHQIGFDHICSNNGDFVGSGFKFTSIYAEPAITSDCFLRIKSSTYASSTASLYTIDTYDNITNVTYDYRLTGAAKEGAGAWTGFGIAANHDIYTGMHTITGADKWDGEWHTRSVDINNESGYVNIIHACGEEVDGSTFDVDNIIITFNDGTVVTEDFSGGEYHFFMYYPSHPERVELIPQ